MKQKVRIWFPIISRFEDDIEIDIPHNYNENEWLIGNMRRILESHPQCPKDIDLSICIYLGIAGMKKLKITDIKSVDEG